MKRYVFALFGLGLLGGLLLGPATALAHDGAGCCASGCSSGCGDGGGCGCHLVTCHCKDKCCPHCGCPLKPVCHICCTTKKVTEYKYCLICEEKCIPRPTCGCKAGCGGDGCGQCGCDGCQSGCDQGGCCVKNVGHLVKIPCVKEVPIRQCTVEWVCPTCGKCCDCGCGGQSSTAPTPATGPAPTSAPGLPPPGVPATAPSAPANPGLPPAPALPPAPKTTSLTPQVTSNGLLQIP